MALSMIAVSCENERFRLGVMCIFFADVDPIDVSWCCDALA